jgi:hypothetical protein
MAAEGREAQFIAMHRQTYDTAAAGVGLIEEFRMTKKANSSHQHLIPREEKANSSHNT